MDVRVAQACGLPIIRAQNGNFGQYSAFGHPAKDYYGLIKGPFQITLSDKVKITLPFIRVADHHYPLLLLGADVLRTYTDPSATSYAGTKITRQENGATGALLFDTREGTSEVPLVWIPQDTQPFRVPGYPLERGG